MEAEDGHLTKSQGGSEYLKFFRMGQNQRKIQMTERVKQFDIEREGTVKVILKKKMCCLWDIQEK